MTPTTKKREIDTDKIKLINEFLPQLPDYFAKTDKLFEIIVTGDGMDHPSLVAILTETKKKVDQLLDMGTYIVRAVVVTLVGMALGGIVFLIRYAPILADLDKIVKSAQP